MMTLLKPALNFSKIALIVIVFAALSLQACSRIGGIQGEAKFPSGADRSETGGDIYAERDTVFGEGGGISLLRGRDDEDDGGGIGVNSFLWRASLDTVSFMPLASADPFGGVILTEWYAPPETPNERFKVNIFILDRQLRSDGVKVAVFRQERVLGEWRDAATSSDTQRQLEDSILTRARQLRVAQFEADE